MYATDIEVDNGRKSAYFFTLGSCHEEGRPIYIPHWNHTFCFIAFIGLVYVLWNFCSKDWCRNAANRFNALSMLNFVGYLNFVFFSSQKDYLYPKWLTLILLCTFQKLLYFVFFCLPSWIYANMDRMSVLKKEMSFYHHDFPNYANLKVRASNYLARLVRYQAY